MTKTSLTAILWFRSDNRKSAIENLKLAGIVALGFAFAMCGAVATAQQPTKIPRIGYLGATSLSCTSARVEAFRQGLRELGYIEGKNIVVEYDYAGSKEDRVPSLVAELVQHKIDVLVSPYLPAILAAKQATKTIPIVMVTTDDPVATGLIDSLARPGGNVTGLTRLTRELSGKRLGILKEVVPTISRIGVLLDADSTNVGNTFKEFEAAAHSLKIQLQSLEVRSPNPSKLQPRGGSARSLCLGLPCS